MERIVTAPWITGLASIAIVVASLYFAQPVLMPLAAAVLLSVVLTPAVRRVERIGLGRAPSVILVMLLVTAGLGGLGWVVIGQVTGLVSQLPDYRDNVTHKVEALHSSLVALERAARHVKEIEKDLGATTSTPQAGQAPQVQVVEKQPELIDTARAYLGSAAEPISTLGLVVIMTIFILLQREDLRDRLLRVLGHRDLWLTTHAIDDASVRVSGYLRTYTLLNAGHGIAIGTGLWLIGLPAALLFGLIAATLRFIPYVGPWISAILPTALSIAVFDSWSGTLLVIAYLAAIELISNNLFEPWLYGQSVGLSPFAIILSAVFWAWLWGGVGLVLAIPLTVCFVVIGHHVPQLQFLAILLGDEPALAPGIRLYQRLLAHDVDEAEELVQDECKERGSDEACDSLLLPALSMLDYERRVGRLDEEELDGARATFSSLGDTLAHCETAKTSAGDTGDHTAAAQHTGPNRGLNVLCLPAGAFGDEIACELLARTLRRRGVHASASRRLLAGEMVERVHAEQPDVVCISALPPTGARVARYLTRRLQTNGDTKDVVVALWESPQRDLEVLRREINQTCVRVTGSFAEVCRQLVDRAGLCATNGAESEPAAEQPATRRPNIESSPRA